MSEIGGSEVGSAPFDFVEGGRTFRCSVAPLRVGDVDAWWWFSVSAESHQRYAPFRAASTDRRDDIRARIVAYYEAFQARRAEPATSGWRGRRPAPAAGTPAAGVPAVSVPTPPAPVTPLS